MSADQLRRESLPLFDAALDFTAVRARTFVEPVRDYGNVERSALLSGANSVRTEHDSCGAGQR